MPQPRGVKETLRIDLDPKGVFLEAKTFSTLVELTVGDRASEVVLDLNLVDCAKIRNYLSSALDNLRRYELEASRGKTNRSRE